MRVEMTNVQRTMVYGVIALTGAIITGFGVMAALLGS